MILFLCNIVFLHFEDNTVIQTITDHDSTTTEFKNIIGIYQFDDKRGTLCIRAGMSPVSNCTVLTTFVDGSRLLRLLP